MTQRDDNTGGWAEYRRLVLSELERLNDAVEKLKDRCIEIQSYIQEEIGCTKEMFNDKLIHYPNHEQLKSILRNVETLGQELSSYKKEQEHDSVLSNRWGFWAAVVSIVGSLVVSIVSLAVAMK